jgi:hypothetical protein
MGAGVVACAEVDFRSVVSLAIVSMRPSAITHSFRQALHHVPGRITPPNHMSDLDSARSLTLYALT